LAEALAPSELAGVGETARLVSISSIAPAKSGDTVLSTKERLRFLAIA
jgi:hypothetical protein